MCEPVSTTALVVGTAAAVTTYSQIQAQKKAAKAQEQAARAAAARERIALEIQRQQIDRSVGLEIFERQRQALRERSRIAVAAGEAGVGGISPARIIAQSLWDASYDIGIHSANRDAMLLQNLLEQSAVMASRDSQIRQARSQITNPFMSMLMIGSNFARGYLSVPRY